MRQPSPPPVTDDSQNTPSPSSAVHSGPAPINRGNLTTAAEVLRGAAPSPPEARIWGCLLSRHQMCAREEKPNPSDVHSSGRTALREFGNRIPMKSAIITTALLVGVWAPLPSLAIQSLEMVEHNSTTLTGTINGLPLSNFGIAPINVSPNEWFVPMPQGLAGSAISAWEEPGEPDRVNVLLLGFDLGRGFGLSVFSDVPLSGLPDLSARIGLQLDAMPLNRNGATLAIALSAQASAPFVPGPFDFSFTDAEPAPDSGSTFSLGVISAAALAGTRRLRSLQKV